MTRQMIDVFLSELTPIGLSMAVLASVLLIGFRIRKPAIEFAQPRREAMIAVVTIAILTAMVTGLLYVLQSGSAVPTEPSLTSYNLGQVISQLVFGLIVLTPVFIALRLRRHGWGSVGFRRAGLAAALSISLLSGLVVCVGLWGLSVWSGRLTAPQLFLSSSSVYALLNMGVVGFTEEVSFRGYLQTRMVDAWGIPTGWAFASIWMALAHFPTLLRGEGLDVGAALAGCLAIIPLSMLMGFVMLRCQNVVGPIVLHTLTDWLQVFF